MTLDPRTIGSFANWDQYREHRAAGGQVELPSAATPPHPDHHNNGPRPLARTSEPTAPPEVTNGAYGAGESPIELSDPWPEPLDEAAFYGLAGEIVRTIEPRTEADPVALLLQVLAAFGSASGRNAHFRAEADRHYGNLFVNLVGVTSKGRKGSSWGQIARVMALVEPAWHAERVL